jgi:hypothetical protein
LKNLKKKEIERKLQEISEMGGIEIDPSMLEGDFDPDQFDAAMQNAFGDDYYADTNDAEKLKGQVADDDDDDDDDDDEEEDEEGVVEKGGVSYDKKEMKQWSQAISKAGAEAKKLMEDVQQYEYDDIIDDTPTRFR